MPAAHTPAHSTVSSEISIGERDLFTPRLQWVYRGLIDPQYAACTMEAAEDILIFWSPLNGGIMIRNGSRTLSVKPGDIFMASDLGLSDDWKSEWDRSTRFDSIRLRLPIGSALRPFDARGVLHLRGADCPALVDATRALAEWSVAHCPGAHTSFLSHAVPPPAWFRLQTLYAVWLETLQEAMAARDRVATSRPRLDPRLLRALECLRNDLRLTEHAIAERVGIGLRQLQRLSREQLGRPLGVFADGVRLQQARALLSAPDARIKSVAASTGFASAQTFARWFRKQTGSSPTDFQDRSRRSV